jgi:hypothetical protein
MASDCDETSCMKKREKDVTRPRRHGNSGNIVKGGETKKYSEKEKKSQNERKLVGRPMFAGSHAVARFTIYRLVSTH